MKAIVCKEASKWHRSKIIFKMPRLSTEIALIREVFPDTLFIHIVRDGRAVALSNCHKFQRREKDKLKALCHSAEHWKEVVTKVQQEKRNVKHFWQIKYEDLCNDVYGYITQILNLAGLDKSRIPWHRCPTRLMPTNDKWLGNCSESEKLLLDQILGSTLAELGYESGKVVG